MTAARTAAAASFLLTVESTPPTELSIGSTTGDAGLTIYTVPGIGAGASVNLQAPATDPSGYTFVQWTLNATAQTAGQKAITFAMTADTLAVAQYTPIYLTVQSTPPTGVVIGSSTGNNGTTNYTSTVAYGGSVNLQAPATDPTGYTFWQWTVNGLSQGAGQKTVVIPGFGTWGSAGNLNGQFEFPEGIAVDRSGNVYVSDTDNDRIQEFTSEGVYITQWGRLGSGKGQLSGPEGIATDSDGNVYVADMYNNRIQKFTSAGVYITQWGRFGTGNGQFESPFGIALDGADNVYVVDSGNSRIQMFTSAGAYVTQWGSRGTGGGFFQIPKGIAIDRVRNLVYVADTFNYLIQEFTSTGGFITQWGSQGAGTGQFDEPYGVAVDGDGNVYVADTINSRVQEFTSAGVYVTQWGSYGSGNGQFELPDGIALDSAGNIYVADTNNMRIQVIGQVISQNILAVAQYTANNGTLVVESTPPTGLSVGSSTGDGGTTNYTVPGITAGKSVNLQAPAADPGGYTFAQWTVNGTAQPAGQKSITFTMKASRTAVAQYTLNTYALAVQSTPPTGLVIGSTTGNDGATNYSNTVPYGASVNLQAPATDPAGFTFSQWTVNGAVQTDGQKSITLTMDAAVTAVAHYTANVGYTLSVQSTPPTGLSVGSSTGQSGTTNYKNKGLAYGASVNLQAPATDPAGFTFSQWMVNGAAQPPGQKSVTFTMDAAVTAVAQYTANAGYTLSVQSAPPHKQVIGSSTGHGGTTNYMVPGVASGTSVNLQAPATDPAGYTFQQWAVNGAAQTAGQKSITFTVDGAVTAVAQYTPNIGYVLTVQSTPPTGLVVSSSTGQTGTTNYTKAGVGNGASVNLQAPAADPTGFIFLQWTVNGAAQNPGQKSVTFTMDGAVIAVAEYAADVGYTLSVESTPPTGLVIASGTGQNGRTNYTKAGVGNGASVNLGAPTVDPAGYTFSQWIVNGAAQSSGQKVITFTMDGPVTAVAQYTRNGFALTVESTPLTGLSIGSSTGQKGTTNYYINKGVADGTSVNLQAPATDPSGYAFWQWTLNGTAQTAGEKSITFTMDGDMTAVAQYTLNGYGLTVQSKPPTGVVIGSSTGNNGTTNYANTVAYGTAVNLQAPATDPAGFTFSQWTVNGAAQTDGQKSITLTMDGAVTAVARYTANIGYTLMVESAPIGLGIDIGSSTGQSGTTNYTVPDIAYGASVNLQAPATDPAGFTFQQWTLNGAAQPGGQKSIAFTMDAAVTAVAHYTANTGYKLSVQSTPSKGDLITSSTFHGGITNYTVPGITYGTSVNLQAPVTDPTGYTFSEWAVNGAAQTPGQKSITFTMDAAVTAVAQYTSNIGYMLSVQSTPPVKLVISSSTGQTGTTNYTIPGIAYGASVNLEAPATDPAGYTFSQWTVNGAAQIPGQKSVTFTMDAAVTAVAYYTANSGYTLSVQSTPPVKLVISSSTGQNGTTNYTKPGIAYGASVNLEAPATDPAGYTFSQWRVNGTAQTAGQKSITFTMTAATTAVAVYVKSD